MKTNSYLWSMLAAATFTLAGCGSEENGITEPMPQGKTAQLELRLTGSGVSTKATGSALPTQNEENTVKRFTVAIFNSDESVNAIQTVTNNTNPKKSSNNTKSKKCRIFHFSRTTKKRNNRSYNRYKTSNNNRIFTIFIKKIFCFFNVTFLDKTIFFTIHNIISETFSYVVIYIIAQNGSKHKQRNYNPNIKRFFLR